MTRTLKDMFNTLTARVLGGQGAGDRARAGQVGPLQKLVAGVVTLTLFAVALMFSVVLFAVVLTVGTVVWGYLWWKMRALRKQMRDNPRGGGGMVIEGEVIREVRTRDERER